MQLPLAFLEQMKQILGTDYDAYIKSFEDVRHYGLRVNTVKITPEQFQKISPFVLSPVYWCNSGFYYEEGERPAKHPYYHAGLYYLQEPSAMSPAAILPIAQNDRVLDICAAPGGKSTQIAGKLGKQGILVANDISAGRAKSLLKNIELCGITNAVVISETPKKLSERFQGYFDKILIDAPCSGEGMFRKEPDMIKSWTPELLSFCQEQQADILSHCADMLCDGGMILYSTCTFAPQENEQTIQTFLDTHPEFSICSIDKQYGFVEGQPPLQQCARLYPHKLKGEGHFLALLQKKGTPVPRTTQKTKTNTPTAFSEFSKQVLQQPIEGNFVQFGDTLCLVPDGLPDTKGLRVLRSGWQIGTLKKDRFEPSQSFAMGLCKQQVKCVLDLSLSDERVLRYLKGETLETPECIDGFTLVCVDGFPLGWGKVQKHRLKNKYPIHWKYE